MNPRVTPAESRAALTALLREFLDTPTMSAQELHDRSTELTITAFALTRVLDELAATPSRDQLDTARWLITNATDYRAILLGLGLLRGNADQRDIPLLTSVDLLPQVDDLLVDVLAGIPGTAPDLMRVADRARGAIRKNRAERLIDHPDPVLRDWVRATPRELLSSDLARKIAEHHDLAALLGSSTVPDGLWEQAGHLLVAMNNASSYQAEIAHYADAQTVYRRWVLLAADRSATLDRAALLTSVAQDLATGAAALVVESRGTEIDRITAILSSPPWTELSAEGPVDVRRAAWIRDRLARIDIPETRFAVRIAVPDPQPPRMADAEARIMVGGLPVAAAAFPNGPALSPEYLLAAGRLRATSTPTEVKLAVAYCTEGCCGALLVTIVREGDEVVFRDWRTSKHGVPPGDIRFDAAGYDREVARAERDLGWEWPGRTFMRLLSGQLEAEPTILGRWDCRFDWCAGQYGELDAVELSFSDPAGQHIMVIDVQGREPTTLAAEIIAAMRETDPRLSRG